MIELYLQSKKTFTFNVTIEGVDPSSLDAYLRIRIDNIELGFQGEISQNHIVVTVPALRKFLKLDLNKTYEIRLEVCGSGFYVLAWKNTVQFKPSIAVKNLTSKSYNIPRIILKRRLS